MFFCTAGTEMPGAVPERVPSKRKPPRSTVTLSAEMIMPDALPLAVKFEVK